MADINQIASQLKIAGLKPLRNDASTRQYWRYDGGVLMLDEADGGIIRREKFIDVAKRLRDAGFRAPEIYGHEAVLGVILMEDFGGENLAQNRNQNDYQKALDNLIRFDAVETNGLTHYDTAIYSEELSRLNRFYLQPLGIVNEEFNELTKPYFEDLSHQASRFVHVDYHAENLMICKDGQLGLLDFQDARFGHALYDLASLVDDIRTDIPPKTAELLLREGLDALNIKDGNFWFHVISIQRLLKIIGIFARLTSEGRGGYDALIPRCFEILKTRLMHPELKLWREWFDEIVPNYTHEIGNRLRAKT